MSGRRTQLLLVVLTVAVAVTGVLVVAGRARAQEEERLITLDLRDATLDDALKLIFRSTPYSYVLAPGVTGRVTLTLNNVTFTQALRAILDMHGLTYRREAGNVYYITQKAPEQVQSPTQVVEEIPASQWPIHWFGPGGRYQLQYLDARVVTGWFGGWEAFMGIVPWAAEGAAGGGAGGGVGGGRGGGGGAGGGRAGGGGGGGAGAGGGRGGGGGGRGGGGGGRGGGGGGRGGGGGGRGGGGGSGTGGRGGRGR